MTVHKTLGLAIAATALLAACATAPTDIAGRRLTLADAGPAPPDYRAAINEALRYRLRDYESARIEYPMPPRPVVFGQTALNVGGAGWELCPMVNARNAMGGYTGYRPVFILWNRGQVVDFKADVTAEVWCRDNNDARLAAGPRLALQ